MDCAWLEDQIDNAQDQIDSLDEQIADLKERQENGELVSAKITSAENTRDDWYDTLENLQENYTDGGCS